MARSELIPEPRGPQREPARPDSSADDNALPHTVRSCADNIANVDSDFRSKDRCWQSLAGAFPLRTTWGIGAVAAIIGLLVVGALWLHGSPSESRHPNWKRVSLAAESGAADPLRLVKIDTAEQVHVVSVLELETADRDRSTTRQVQAALLRNDLRAAHTAVANAQRVSTDDDAVVSRESLERPELVTSLRNGTAEFYRLELFDSCDEDGDVVEIVLNNAVFAKVTLRHQGTPLVLPLAQGKNTVVVRAVEDGGGGITVMFRSSNGDYFARDMIPGEDHRMEVVVP